MQSWGTRSRFDERDTEMEPSKSGVLGLLCAALGRDRSADLADLAALRMGVRVDRQGFLRVDYQTSQNVLAADASKIHATTESRRHYLSDAKFLVGLEGEDRDALAKLDEALRDPVWPLFLGRKSYVPSLPVNLQLQPWGTGVVDQRLEDALAANCLADDKDEAGIADSGAGDEVFRFVLEVPGPYGSRRWDQPVAPFARRRFGARFVQSVTARRGETPGVPQ
jgi:CRISPR system Cascade subunit CasD